MEYCQSSEIEFEESSSIPPFIEDSLRPVSAFYIIWLILAALISYTIYKLSGDPIRNSLINSQFIYYTIILIHIIYRLKKGRLGNMLAPDIIFIMFYTLFHLGYVTLFTLKIIPYSDYVFHYETSISKAMFIVNLGLIGFLFGYEFMGKKTNINIPFGGIIAPGNSWCIFGLLLMVIAISMHLIGLSFLGPRNLMNYGYSAIQNATDYISYWKAMLIGKSTLVMVLGMTIYMIASSLRYGKLFHSKLGLILSVVYFVIVIMEGERGSILAMGVPIMLVRHYFVKQIKFRYIVLLFITAVLLFAGLRVVRTIVFQPTKMIEEYKYTKKSSPERTAWYATFVEMGTSFMVVNIVANDVPSQEPYWRGASWRDSAFHIVPFLQGITIRLGWSTWAPSTWITTTYFGREAAGRAFTVAAEGYLNFGFFGVFFELFLFGVFVRWLTVRFSRTPSAMWALIMLGCFGPVIMVIRNHLNIVTNKCAMVILVAFILDLFFSRKVIEQEDVYISDYNLKKFV